MVSHPARFSKEVLQVCAELLDGFEPCLDMFAGTGMIHDLPFQTLGLEIEKEWASMREGTIIGDALHLPFKDRSFRSVCTSPVFGNRLSDHHNAKDKSRRRSYTFDLGRQLHPNNSGTMQWGTAYRDFHEKAWLEAKRVLGDRLCLNIKDHYRNGVLQDVTGWHVTTLCRMGFTLMKVVPVNRPGLRYGANRERTPYEWVLLFKL